MKPIALLPSLLVLAGIVATPSVAQADCLTPWFCACSVDAAETILDAVILDVDAQENTRFEVLEQYGTPIDIPADGTTELPVRHSNTLSTMDEGRRTLLHISGGTIILNAPIADDDSSLECSDARDPLAVEDAVEFGLMPVWEDCRDAVADQTGTSLDCDDTARCSLGGQQPPVTWMALGLFALVGRRYRRNHSAA